MLTDRTLLQASNTSAAVNERLIVRKLQVKVTSLETENRRLKNSLQRYEGFPDVQQNIRALQIENAEYIETIESLNDKLKKVEEEKEVAQQKNSWWENRFKIACERYRSLHDQFITNKKRRT